MRRTSLLGVSAWLWLCAAGLAACASDKRSPETPGTTAAAQDASPSAEDAGAPIDATSAADASNPSDASSGAATKADADAGPSIQQQLSLDALQRALELPPAEASKDSPLRFEIVQHGPDMPWTLGIINTSDRRYELVGDSRLLSFSVEVPGKRKPTVCQLPKSLIPTRETQSLKVKLLPGEAVIKSFDPRLYCFTSKGGQSTLVPGAVITASFGFPVKTKTVWKRGKPHKVEVEQKEPFVAEVAPKIPHGKSARSAFYARTRKRSEPEDSAKPAKGKAETSGKSDPAKKAEKADKPGKSKDSAKPIKRLEARPFSLDSRYAAWSAARLKPPRAEGAEAPPLELSLKRGSDAHAERTATITLVVKNKSKRSHRVYLRRELVSFEVMGPDGLVACDPQPDLRAPEAQAFLYLPAGGSITISSRLVELCPRGTFGTPGLYLIHARFNATRTGAEFGYEAFVGRLVSEEPVAVRIRHGEEPFFETEDMVKVKLPARQAHQQTGNSG